ncbi:MAG: hypothetical protein WKG06_40285 [Segetibacter sp.]
MQLALQKASGANKIEQADWQRKQEQALLLLYNNLKTSFFDAQFTYIASVNYLN